MSRRIVAMVALSVSALLVPGLAPAAAASSNVSCRITPVGANVVPNRHLPGVGVVYGTDAAAATVTCVSLTGDAYDLWVDVAVHDAAGKRIAFQYGTPLPAVLGVAAAVTTTTAAGYDEGASAPVPRSHRVTAWAYIDGCPACAGELKDVVSVEFPA